MKNILFKGCGTAIATPFSKDGINFKEFEKLIEMQIKHNADAIIVCGTTGESATMTMQERLDVIKFAVDISKGRIPIIAGTGSNNTKNVIEMNKQVEKLGVDGLLIVTPYYNKTTQEGLITHYEVIAENTNLPIILYNVPSRTGVNILPKTCLELSKIPNIVAIKEASGDISQIIEIASLCRDNLTIYSGNDDQIIPILSIGGMGVISVVSNIKPDVVHDICYNYFEGKIEKAKNKQLEIIPLIKCLFSEVNPIPIKAALNLIGYDYGIPRLPLIEMTESGKEKLKKLLNKGGNINYKMY